MTDGGPPQDHWFPFGQALNQFRGGDPHEPYLSWVRRWPRADLIRYMGPLNSDAVLAVSIEAHVQIMKTNCYAFTKPGFYRRAIFPLTGRGLVFQDGEEHRRHRRIVAGSFSSANIRSMAPIFHKKAAELCASIEGGLTPGEGGVVERE
jgi:cytochrome P450